MRRKARFSILGLIFSMVEAQKFWEFDTPFSKMKFQEAVQKGAKLKERNYAAKQKASR